MERGGSSSGFAPSLPLRPPATITLQTTTHNHTQPHTTTHICLPQYYYQQVAPLPGLRLFPLPPIQKHTHTHTHTHTHNTSRNFPIRSIYTSGSSTSKTPPTYTSQPSASIAPHHTTSRNVYLRVFYHKTHPNIRPPQYSWWEIPLLWGRTGGHVTVGTFRYRDFQLTRLRTTSRKGAPQCDLLRSYHGRNAAI